MKTGAGLSALLLMSACAAVPDGTIPDAGGGSCDAARAQSLIRRGATTELGAEALRLTGARALRWITPGSAVTMDYRTDRLNIKLDAQNRVESVNCG